MAIARYNDGKWNAIGAMASYVSGAWQGREVARRYYNGAWTEAWRSAFYYLKQGVLQNGATLGYNATQGTGSVYVYTGQGDTELTALNFNLTSDMAGKKIYVKASSNVSASQTDATNPYLMIYYPSSSNSWSPQLGTLNSDGLIVLDIPSNYYYGGSLSTRLEIHKSGGIPTWVNYHIIDVYVK